MPKPPSTDLRERLTSAVAGGMSRRSAAQLFSIAPSTTITWVDQKRRVSLEAAQSTICACSTATTSRPNKTAHAAEQQRPDILRLVFIDATGASTKLATSRSPRTFPSICLVNLLDRIRQVPKGVFDACCGFVARPSMAIGHGLTTGR